MSQSPQWHRGEGVGIQKKLNREKKQISNSISSVLKPEAQSGIKHKRDFFQAAVLRGGNSLGLCLYSFWRSKTR